MPMRYRLEIQKLVPWSVCKLNIKKAYDRIVEIFFLLSVLSLYPYSELLCLDLWFFCMLLLEFKGFKAKEFAFSLFFS